MKKGDNFYDTVFCCFKYNHMYGILSAPCYVKQVNGTRYEQFRNVRFEGQWIDSFKTLYAFCEPGYKSARGVGNYATCDRGNLNLLVCSKRESQMHLK